MSATFLLIFAILKLANKIQIKEGSPVYGTVTDAINETNRRREIQEKYNKEHNIVPQTIKKEIRDVITNIAGGDTKKSKKNNIAEIKPNIEELEQEMRQAAKELNFERAMELRDIIFEIKTTY